MDHIGIDVHKKESQICILSEDGERLEPRVRTIPARFADVLGDLALQPIELATSHHILTARRFPTRGSAHRRAFGEPCDRGGAVLRPRRTLGFHSSPRGRAR